MHLVPFGERLPFQSVMPWLGDLDLGQAEWTPGDSLVLLSTPSDTVAVMICFESIFPEMARDARKKGATLLAVLTNDQWFGKTGALYQHAAMSVFRAVETRLPLARCANTGITFFVDTRGRVYEAGGVFTREVRTAAIDRPGESTPYSRWGDWVGNGALFVSLALLLLSAFWRRRTF